MWIGFTNPFNLAVNGSKVSQRSAKTFTKKHAPHLTLQMVHKSLAEQLPNIVVSKITTTQLSEQLNSYMDLHLHLTTDFP